MVVRLTEIVLILLGLTILILVGFGPLFAARDRYATIRQECELFYGGGGPDAVAHCMTEMARHSTAAAR
jgi:hypothetical protein